MHYCESRQPGKKGGHAARTPPHQRVLPARNVHRTTPGHEDQESTSPRRRQDRTATRSSAPSAGTRREPKPGMSGACQVITPPTQPAPAPLGSLRRTTREPRPSSPAARSPAARRHSCGPHSPGLKWLKPRARYHGSFQGTSANVVRGDRHGGVADGRVQQRRADSTAAMVQHGELVGVQVVADETGDDETDRRGSGHQHGMARVDLVEDAAGREHHFGEHLVGGQFDLAQQGKFRRIGMP